MIHAHYSTVEKMNK